MRSIVFTFLIFLSLNTFAELVEGTGVASLENVTPQKAEYIALEKAKQDAMSKLGSIVTLDEILIKTQIDNEVTQSYRKFAEVFSASKLKLVKKEVSRSLNHDKFSVRVHALFEFDKKEYIKEVRAVFRIKQQEELDKLIVMQNEYALKNKKLDKILKSGKYGDFEEIDQLISEKTRITNQVDKVMYYGGLVNSQIGNRVESQIARIGYLAKSLDNRLASKDYYPESKIKNIQEYEKDVRDKDHYKVGLRISWETDTRRQRDLLYSISCLEGVEIKNKTSYTNFLESELKKTNARYPLVRIKYNKKQNQIMVRRKPVYRKVILLLENDHRIFKRKIIGCIPITRNFDYNSLTSGTTKTSIELNKHSSKKTVSLRIRERNTLFYRSPFSVQLKTGISTVNLNHEWDDQDIIGNIQIPELKPSGQLSLNEINLFANVNIFPPNTNYRGTRLKLGASVYKPESYPFNDFFKNAYYSPLAALEFGKIRAFGYTGFGVSFKYNGFKHVPQNESLNSSSFFKYASEYSLYFIQRGLFVGFSLFHYIPRYVDEYPVPVFEGNTYMTVGLNCGVILF